MRLTRRQPRATELKFADGSTLRNDFSNATLNAKLDEMMFDPKWDADFKIEELSRNSAP